VTPTPPKTTPLLDVRALSVAFQSGKTANLAVKDVSFTLQRGETVALVGESGSGKTTAALSVLRLLPSSATLSGEIVFDGQELLALPEASMRSIRGRRISVIFQEPMTSLNPLQTIEAQVGEVLKVHRGLDDTAARVRVLELLAKVGIREPEKRLAAFPHELSGGQRQRVMIAMALANEPDLLVADEPTTALDVTIQAQILDLLADLQREMGMAMLLITHDLGIVRRMADRVYVLKNGEVVESGATQELFAAPKHAYTQHLINAEPKGLAPVTDTSAPVVLETTDIKVWFPIKKGLLRKTVDHVKAVDGLSLTLRAGETIGIVGESGSGKTTLGLALLRLISSTGPIAYAGKRIDAYDSAAMRPLRREMQVVFQDPYGSLSPRLSVGQIIEEGLVIQNPELDATGRRERVGLALADVGLDPAMQDRYPHEFSGGQRQRIAIARAMVLEPKFVMLDEPTSALDMSVQAQIADLLRDLQSKRRLAYLFISHDLKVVRALCNYVLVMRNGKVVEEGPSADIFERPKADYTKALLAAAFDLKVAHKAALAI
jgi:microcin C transport system ATP-binding protein